jgi:hypothetical protein
MTRLTPIEELCAALAAGGFVLTAIDRDAFSIKPRSAVSRDLAAAISSRPGSSRRSWSTTASRALRIPAQTAAASSSRLPRNRVRTAVPGAENRSE